MLPLPEAPLLAPLPAPRRPALRPLDGLSSGSVSLSSLRFTIMDTLTPLPLLDVDVSTDLACLAAPAGIVQIANQTGYRKKGFLPCILKVNIRLFGQNLPWNI